MLVSKAQGLTKWCSKPKHHQGNQVTIKLTSNNELDSIAKFFYTLLTQNFFMRSHLLTSFEKLNILQCIIFSKWQCLLLSRSYRFQIFFFLIVWKCTHIAKMASYEKVFYWQILLMYKEAECEILLLHIEK